MGGAWGILVPSFGIWQEAIVEAVFPLGLCSVGLIEDPSVWPEFCSVSEGQSALDRPFAFTHGLAFPCRRLVQGHAMKGRLEPGAMWGALLGTVTALFPPLPRQGPPFTATRVTHSPLR